MRRIAVSTIAFLLVTRPAVTVAQPTLATAAGWASTSPGLLFGATDARSAAGHAAAQKVVTGEWGDTQSHSALVEASSVVGGALRARAGIDGFTSCPISQCMVREMAGATAFFRDRVTVVASTAVSGPLTTEPSFMDLYFHLSGGGTGSVSAWSSVGGSSITPADYPTAMGAARISVALSGDDVGSLIDGSLMRIDGVLAAGGVYLDYTSTLTTYVDGVGTMVWFDHTALTRLRLPVTQALLSAPFTLAAELSLLTSAYPQLGFDVPDAANGGAWSFDNDYSHTAGVGSIRLVDASGNDVTRQYRIAGLEGRDYTTDIFGPTVAAPEPAAIALLAPALALIGLRRRSVRRRA